MNIYHKNIYRVLMLFLMLFCTVPMTALAKEDGINKIEVSVNLKSDGSADITEIWEIDRVYEGSEYYKALYNFENMFVSKLTVADDSGKLYETMDSWDSSASFDEKAFKCGILEAEKGYELCWGISEMGNRTYTITYHVTNLVKSYHDKDGFYHQFISDNLSSPPKSATVNIRIDDVPLSEKNAKIWAFGFEGEIYFENGTITATSDGKLGSNDYINILVEFEKGIFDTIAGKGSFEDIKENAFNGNKLDKKMIIIIVTVVIIIILFIFILIYVLNCFIWLADGTKIKRISINKAELNSSIPFGNSIPATFSAFSLDSALGYMHFSTIAAYIVKWQLEGIIQFDSKKKANEENGKTIIKLIREPEEDENEIALYRLFQKASKNNSITMHQWENWTKKHYKKMVQWEKELKKFGDNYLIESGWAAQNDKGKLRFTASGYKMNVRMLGFYKYLKSFKKSAGSMTAQREYWGEYLIYASLFQFSNYVTKGLKEIDSGGFHDFCSHYNMDTTSFLLYMNYSQQFSKQTVSSAEAGDGGSSYLSGGDGFSGGGGGGSR